jgi:hypothetical protein
MLAVLVVVLAGVGTGLLVAAFHAPPPRPPQPVAQARPAGAAAAEPAPEPAAPTPDAHPPTAGSAPTAGTPDPQPGLARSQPTRITIPKIGVAAPVVPVGLDRAGAVQAPPLAQAQLAGWYEPGPSPGEDGSAVIVGHVDSRRTGPGVFFRLGALRPGDTIEVTRADGATVRFTVDGVEAYPKAAFPAGLVYGPAGPVATAALRLVTCGGRYDARAHAYLDNVIVFATLSSGQSTNESVHS